ncbi:MBL fold metallo-hydrolase [Siccirubricoccus sp. KC 17139]|uniref:MBL fold metallo-hydrolase n=1 Tax=Siccirubricoccus soli TaxID=2899147 RepID=A0ABT1CYZ8_9PROT|nr:MBL fold metallo-hydrolase [Siccirubricoccus soli]MCO6414877.1 MBL fold metallo-hydrolase [Siccirubricoccus soli]MCP2681007.1 MBL fold metallo-hydrolase [Siccirubricoccus soli]
MRETTRRIRASGGQAQPIPVDGVELFALCDGYLNVDMSRFPDVVRGIGDALAAADGQDLDDLAISVNAFLIRTPDRLCLVDAGDGKRRGDQLGQLPLALQRAGHKPEEVTDLLLTHLHGDHAAGLAKDGAPAFPNAKLHVAAEEIAFWRAPEKLDELQSVQLPFAEAALRLYADRLVVIRPGEEVLPGVTVRALPGHTPGQVGFLLGQRDPVLLSADVLHLPALQVQHPEWGFLFDADRAGARAMRQQLLAEAAESGLRLAGAHIPFPGVIRILAGAGGLSFETAGG